MRLILAYEYSKVNLFFSQEIKSWGNSQAFRYFQRLEPLDILKLPVHLGNMVQGRLREGVSIGSTSCQKSNPFERQALQM